jgi:hypothetical protein
MSHTVRRRKAHTAHERGRTRQGLVRRCPPPVRPARPQRTRDELEALATDHAVVRWLERVVGVDVRAQFARDMLTPERAELASVLQNGRLRVNDSRVVLVICGGRVVSVIVEEAV